MMRVIDNLLLDEQALQNHPEFLAKLGPGLLVTIDAEQQPTSLIGPGSPVRIHRPDGSVIDRVVRAVEIWGPKVGLFFPDTKPHDIPNSSEIELLAS